MGHLRPCYTLVVQTVLDLELLVLTAEEGLVRIDALDGTIPSTGISLLPLEIYEILA